MRVHVANKTRPPLMLGCVMLSEPSGAAPPQYSQLPVALETSVLVLVLFRRNVDQCRWPVYCSVVFFRWEAPAPYSLYVDVQSILVDGGSKTTAVEIPILERRVARSAGYNWLPRLDSLADVVRLKKGANTVALSPCRCRDTTVEPKVRRGGCFCCLVLCETGTEPEGSRSQGAPRFGSVFPRVPCRRLNFRTFAVAAGRRRRLSCTAVLPTCNGRRSRCVETGCAGSTAVGGHLKKLLLRR